MSARGVARGTAGMAPPIVDCVNYYRNNWLCRDVGPAVFSKVTLFSLPEVFCGLYTQSSSFDGND